MTYRELYDSALRIVSETDENTNMDYEERAEYILAAFCSECAGINKKYCKANSLIETDFLQLHLASPFLQQSQHILIVVASYFSP